MKQMMLGLRAETSIHAGTGQNTGVIDLPIQREVHTGWPCVFGSAVKGAFRAHAEVRCAWGGDKAQRVFGKEDASEASAVSMSDARLLLLPVRSLTGHFRLVTCPAILERLKRDMALIGMQEDVEIPPVQQGQVVAPSGAGEIFLEEFRFAVRASDRLADLVLLLEQFGASSAGDQMLVMHDDDFAWFASNATAVTPHIAIDNATKTVKNGALWYEESLPPDTLLYTMLMGTDAEVADVAGMFADKPFIQIGGNETVGMGWCHVKEVKA